MNNTWNINLFFYFLPTIFNNSLNLVKFVIDVMQITHQHLPGWLFNVCITRLQTRRGLPVGGRGLPRPMRERCVLPWAWPPGESAVVLETAGTHERHFVSLSTEAVDQNRRLFQSKHFHAGRSWKHQSQYATLDIQEHYQQMSLIVEAISDHSASTKVDNRHFAKSKQSSGH